MSPTTRPPAEGWTPGAPRPLLSPLTKANQYCKEGWLPVSATALRTVQTGLASGRYQDDRQSLLRDLARDHGLFLTAIRRLFELSGDTYELLLRDDDLLSTLHATPLDRFAAILEGPASFLSRHVLSEATPEQAQQLSESLITSETAEFLATSADIDPLYAHSAALFRQLGMTLVAWNYPHVFARAFSQTHERPLKETLTRTLGFSPGLLGVAFLRSWNLDPVIREVAGDRAVQGTLSPAAQKRANSLTKLCEAGEALARASFPDSYPTAANDFERAAKAVQDALGPDAFDRLCHHLTERFESYSHVLGRPLEVPRSVADTARDKPAANRQVSVPGNHYISACPEPLRNELMELYGLLSSHVVSREALDLIIGHIIPDAGFSRGAIYLLDPEEMLLEPRLAIRSPIPLLSLRSIPVHQHEPQELARVFLSAGVLEVTQSIFENSPARALAGMLGQTTRSGLLYLELGPSLLREDESRTKVIFKAIRKAVTDTLKFE